MLEIYIFHMNSIDLMNLYINLEFSLHVIFFCTILFLIFNSNLFIFEVNAYFGLSH